MAYMAERFFRPTACNDKFIVILQRFFSIMPILGEGKGSFNSTNVIVVQERPFA